MAVPDTVTVASNFAGTSSTDTYAFPTPPAALDTLVEGLMGSGIAIALFSPDDRLALASAAFNTAYAVQPGAQTFSSIIRHCHAHHSGPLIATADVNQWLAEASKSRRTAKTQTTEVPFCDGRWMLVTETTFNDGWLLTVFQDFTTFKLKETGLTNALDAAIHAAETDPLTGLANRRAIMRYFESRTQSASETVPLAIAVLDIDYFKQINDVLGHDAGDDLLRHFGRYSHHIFRNETRAGRVGGEEFLLVMPQTTEAAAVTALQRFRHHLHRANQLLTQQRSFTFSAGVAEWRPGLQSRDLYRLADKALYSSKAQGRDRITAASSLELPGTSAHSA